MSDDVSLDGILAVVILVAVVYFLGIPLHTELTDVHTETITIRGIAGTIVEDTRGTLWKVTGIDKFTLTGLHPGVRLEVQWTGPAKRWDPTSVTVENITYPVSVNVTTHQPQDGSFPTVLDDYNVVG